MKNATVGSYQDVTRSGNQLVATIPTIVMLSSLFFVIGIVGIIGNFLVIYVVLSDKRMRSSVTNLLIMNLAVSDFVIMVVCVPDIVQFMMNSGWQMGVSLCRFFRFVEVTALYASVMTLVSVCIERRSVVSAYYMGDSYLWPYDDANTTMLWRQAPHIDARYIAIIHPIKAHIVCYRARILITIVCIWPIAMAIASPNVIYNVIDFKHPNFTPCIMNFPSPTGELAFKYMEFLMFYLIPVILQITLYVRIGQRLFNTDALKRMEPISGKQRFTYTMRSRKGVVKMLIAGVVVYFVCFSPHQVLLFYSTFSKSPLEVTWPFLIFTNVMAYASSASNPLLYSVFSHKFRRKLGNTLCCRQASLVIKAYPIANNHVANNASPHSFRQTYRIKSFRTSISEV